MCAPKASNAPRINTPSAYINASTRAHRQKGTRDKFFTISHLLPSPLDRNRPATHLHSDQTGGVQTRMNRVTAAGRKLRILIVDDDDRLRRWLRAQLEAKRFWVHEESQGDEALETFLRKGPWDFVLSDLYFFRGERIRNGLELARAIAAACPKQRMAIHTSERCFEAPGPVLHKPYPVGALLKLLRNSVMPFKVDRYPR